MDSCSRPLCGEKMLNAAPEIALALKSAATGIRVVEDSRLRARRHGPSGWRRRYPGRR